MPARERRTAIAAWSRYRGGGGGSDEGSMTVFFAITVVGLLVLIGLIVDGGAKLRATQRADAIAAEAARAAGQAIDLPAAVAGEPLRVDVAGAVAAANTYLAAAEVAGSVAVADAGDRIVVTTTVDSPAVFLAVIGIPTLTAAGDAEVLLVHAVSGSPP